VRPAGEQRLQLGGGLRGGETRTETPDRIEEVVVPVLDDMAEWSPGARGPLGPEERIPERGRHDSDDGDLLGVEPERPADDGGIAPETDARGRG